MKDMIIKFSELNIKPEVFEGFTQIIGRIFTIKEMRERTDKMFHPQKNIISLLKYTGIWY